MRQAVTTTKCVRNSLGDLSSIDGLRINSKNLTLDDQSLTDLWLSFRGFYWEFSMSTLTVGKKVDGDVDDPHEAVVAVYPTADGFRYVFKLEECDPFKTAEQIQAVSPANLM